ncbi:4-demethylwyosine synthase TYW1 [Candidatus Woesearchaeota archaeon]|nr:MAG: 4-demethylwyosine synthase TYW1 [Candidatus Woesearchaeota archaeon]
MVSDALRRDFEKQQYRVVGNHSVVKVCEWTKKSLRGGKLCYKNTFYGIHSWQCVEMSPTWFCDHRCVFCWRDTKYSWPSWSGPVDDPKLIVDGCIREWKKLLFGFGGFDKTDKKRYQEAMSPKHFAISLTGEPTFYPRLPELIDEIHSRGMTSFLVTNGTVPDMIEKLLTHQPTQIYVSIVGPDKETYVKVADPLPKDSWNRLMKTLRLLKNFKRSVLRLTLVKGLNMFDPEGYASLVRLADPDWVELKAYMFIGHSRERLEIENMPLHKDIKEFAARLAEILGWKIVSERAESRVVLLAKNDSEDRFLSF